MLYVELRLNRNCRLVNYSYYIKYLNEDDNILFLHINLNVAKFLKIDRSKSVIQSLISLNDKSKEECIVIIKDLYKHIDE